MIIASEGLPNGVFTRTSRVSPRPAMEYRPLPPMMPIFTFLFFAPDFVERVAAFAIFNPPSPVQLPELRCARGDTRPGFWYRGRTARASLPSPTPESTIYCYRASPRETNPSP